MVENPPDFVKWREEFISQERGNRLVHFFLEDTNGESHLAVIGTERSLRHMLYVASEDFCMSRFGFSDKSAASTLKWRSRREAVDWLSSLIPTKSLPKRTELKGFIEGQTGQPSKLRDKDGGADIVWSGAFWICGKQLYHYQAFCRNGSTISAHSFALIMSEEETRYLAYLEDMYEDKKGQKKVKVRWFHQNREFACPIPPPAPHPSEVFITPYSQVISVECVDDVATVLTPEDYQRCLNSPHPYPSSLSGIRLCFRQYSKNKFKYFDLRTLRGYYNQPALLRLNSMSVTEPGPGPRNLHRRQTVPGCGDGSGSGSGSGSGTGDNKAGHRKVRSGLSGDKAGPRNQIKPPYTEGQKIEVLCQDSGIRGCWFRCTVLELCHKQIKVQYDDVTSPDDGEQLEEWVMAYRFADPDKLGMRTQGRLTIRPSPPFEDSVEGVTLFTGSAIDVWRNDAWWEGVVVSPGKADEDRLNVYHPAENIFSVCQRKDARVSRDWIHNQWVNIDPKPEVLAQIPPNPKAVGSTKRAESGSSAMSGEVKDGNDKQVGPGICEPPLVMTGCQIQTNEKKRSRDEAMLD
ncbi:Agenet domain-containing protein [Carex littledalei]|uniref:Agenet domain-containing protein n=1 Tax=Carex littledalei TaxID=544730 RepID=A0A833QGR3_9POAL|nr:Agenet domain-containing protein [Carex littledalei]